MLFLGSSSIYSSHINHSGQYFGPDLRLAWTKTAISIRSVQNADCRLGTKCRPGTKCRLRIYTVFPSERDNMSSYNLPSVTQSLFRDHLSRLFALMWNIPCRFLITIVLNIISSLHLVFSLSARVSWCDGSVCDSSIQFSLKIKNWKLMSIFDFRYFLWKKHESAKSE